MNLLQKDHIWRKIGRQRKWNPLCCIDALPQEGEIYVKQGVLVASLEYPTGGREAIEIALKILNGEEVPKEITLRSRFFTRDSIGNGG